MTKLKDYIASQLIGKKVHFRCQCLFPLDFIGVVKDYTLSNDRIIWKVERENGKIIDIELNHPNMMIEIL